MPAYDKDNVQELVGSIEPEILQEGDKGRARVVVNPTTGAILVEGSISSAPPAIQTLCTAYATTGAITAQVTGETHAIQIIATDTFSLTLYTSLDNTNWATMYTNPITTSDMYLIDNIPLQYIKLDVTANAGEITAYLV